MTASAYGSAMPSPETRGASHEPVLVAVKPYDGFEAALATAQWLAAHQKRPLHMLSVLEPSFGSSRVKLPWTTTLSQWNSP